MQQEHIHEHKTTTYRREKISFSPCELAAPRVHSIIFNFSSLAFVVRVSERRNKTRKRVFYMFFSFLWLLCTLFSIPICYTRPMHKNSCELTIKFKFSIFHISSLLFARSLLELLYSKKRAFSCNKRWESFRLTRHSIARSVERWQLVWVDGISSWPEECKK